MADTSHLPASNSPFKVRRVTSWAAFKQKKIIFPDNFNTNVKLHSGVDTPFTAMVVCTVYSKSKTSPGMHVFFATKFHPQANLRESLFRGYIPRYGTHTRSEQLNPDFTSAQYIRWGSIHSLQVPSNNRKGTIQLLEHLESIAPPVEDYHIPDILTKNMDEIDDLDYDEDDL
jgi:hypothetical protein